MFWDRPSCTEKPVVKRHQWNKTTNNLVVELTNHWGVNVLTKWKVSGLPFSLTPGNIDTFYKMFDRVLDVVWPLVHGWLTCLSYVAIVSAVGVPTCWTGLFCCPEEDMAHTHVLSIVTGPAANYRCIALDEASPSYGNTFRIHSALLAFLQSYLPPCAAEECTLPFLHLWRMTIACQVFVTRSMVRFPSYSLGWRTSVDYQW